MTFTDASPAYSPPWTEVPGAQATPPPSRRPWWKRPWALVLFAAILVVLTSAVTAYMTARGSSSSSPSATPIVVNGNGQPGSRSTSVTIFSAASMDQATEHAYKVAGPSVVYVERAGIGSGSGVIYDARGDIVTNAHVVQGASNISVTLTSGRKYTAQLLGTDTADDLAVIRIQATGLKPARFAAAGTYHIAQNVLAIGSPLGLEGSVTSGLISGLNRVVNVGFAVPSPRIIYVAKQIIAAGAVQNTGRAYLGLAPVDASSVSPSTSGAAVARVAPQGPAAAAGVQQGDVITEADGKPVTDAQTLLTILAGKKPGDTLTLKIDRNGTISTVNVRLGQLPA